MVSSKDRFLVLEFDEELEGDGLIMSSSSITPSSFHFCLAFESALSGVFEKRANSWSENFCSMLFLGFVRSLKHSVRGLSLNKEESPLS